MKGLQVEIRKPIRKRSLSRTRSEPPIGVKRPIDYIVHAIGAFGLEFVAERKAQHVRAINRIDGVEVGEFDGQQSCRRKQGVELGQLLRRYARPWHVNVVNGRLNNVAQSVYFPEAAAHPGPYSRCLGRDLRPGVQNGSVVFGGGLAGSFRLAIIGEAASSARDHG